MFKAAVFDMDGVLVDTEPLHFDAWFKALNDLSQKITKEEYSKYAGRKLEEQAKDLAKARNNSLDQEKFIELKNKYFFEAAKHSRLCFYATEAVEFFRKKKLLTAIATSSDAEETEIKLKKLEIRNLFDVIITSDKIKHGKPNPEIYLAAAKKLKVKPEECIAFEDTSPGARAAKSANMFTIAVPNLYTKNQDFSFCDKRFDNLQMAVEWIGKELLF